MARIHNKDNKKKYNNKRSYTKRHLPFNLNYKAQPLGEVMRNFMKLSYLAQKRSLTKRKYRYALFFTPFHKLKINIDMYNILTAQKNLRIERKRQLLKNRILYNSNIPHYYRPRLRENTKWAITEFYQFWFNKIKPFWWWWANPPISLTSGGRGALQWRMFRAARYSRIAQRWRNRARFNWTKANRAKKKMDTIPFKTFKIRALVKCPHRLFHNRLRVLRSYKTNYRSLLQEKAYPWKNNNLLRKVLLKWNHKWRSLALSRLNSYYNTYTGFSRDFFFKSIRFWNNKRLTRFRKKKRQRYPNFGRWESIRNNPFPNYGKAKFLWHKKQFAKYNPEHRHAIYYRLFDNNKLFRSSNPSWVDWKVTNKFRKLLHRWIRRKKRRKVTHEFNLTEEMLSKFVIFSRRSHLRRIAKKGKYSVIIRIATSNFFINVVRSTTASPIKIFSGGSLKAPTRRLRRSYANFVKTFRLLIKFLKSQNIRSLHYIKIIQSGINKNLRIEKKNIRFLIRLLKEHKLERIKRWILELKEPHSLLPRASKLRRK